MVNAPAPPPHTSMPEVSCISPPLIIQEFIPVSNSNLQHLSSNPHLILQINLVVLAFENGFIVGGIPEEKREEGAIHSDGEELITLLHS